MQQYNEEIQVMIRQITQRTGFYVITADISGSVPISLVHGLSHVTFERSNIMILTNEDTLTPLNDDVSQVDIMVLISSYNYNNNYDIVWITTGVEEVHKSA